MRKIIECKGEQMRSCSEKEKNDDLEEERREGINHHVVKC